MLKFLIPLLLLPGLALAQQVRLQPKGFSPAIGSGGGVLRTPNLPPEEPLYSGPLTLDETNLIIKALERYKNEVHDPYTAEIAKKAQVGLVLQEGTLVDRTLLPTIGLALSMATNVEIDKKDENGVTVIDNAASRAASKPYCDLFKKLNPRSGCVRW
jgi:hypothetical protein